MGWMLFALGVVHAYLIPMMPFIYMFFISTGMLILVAEAMVAAPIWAFMHIRMDGGDFVDNVQRPGYMIAWNLFLRPALAVFGLILSFSLFSGSFWLLNETFGIASEVATPNDWGIAAIGMLVMAAIQVYMHYQLALRSFGLITELPERVSRWFGQGCEQLNDSRDAEKAFGLLVDNSEKRLAGAGDRASGIMEGQTQMDGVEATQAKTTPGNGSVKARKK